MICRVKGLSIVNETEVDVFLELSCILYDPTDIGNLISGSSAFSKSSLNIWKFSVHILLKPDLEYFENYLANMWNEHSYVEVGTFFDITQSLLWNWNENWHFPVLWPLLFFTFAVILSAVLSQHCLLGLKWLSWNSVTSTSFVHMKLPTAHLTSQSRISGSRWVTTPSCYPRL